MFQTAFQPTAFQNDAFQIVITPPTPTGPTGGDGWTKEEYKRYKEIQKKLRKAEEKRIAAIKSDQEARRALIESQINPKQKTSKQKLNKVESNQVVSVDTPSQLANIDRYIANLEKQQQDLQTAVAMKAAKLRLEQELAVLEAKRLAELDDEEALLALIL
jgi:hypothetical protein